MLLDDRVLPSSIADERSQALVELAERLEALDRSLLLVYHIDTVPAAALFALAWQFDVLGFNGWDLAHSDAERRELLKGAIERHRFRGTPWAIKAALEAVGYAGTLIEEGIAVGLDHWAKFRVRVGSVPDNVELTQAERDLIVGVVKAYKNARSHLDTLVYTTPAVEDAAALPNDPPMNVFIDALLLYDGAFSYDGAITYRGSDGEPIEIP
ncbi:MAG: phage tail protein I [Gemmatimonadaceae bacterium]